ncbi:MAG: DUF5777 family beta-barrel protein [Gemmatimonadota bacterium]|nr:DUF5777 family beta-barrel protein [Gemmatimonadota bacterium]
MERITKSARLGLCAAAVCLASPAAASAQTVFASTHSATLPTAASIGAGVVLVEVSHRFGYLSDGAGDLWGLDGFVLNRLGLAFAVSDRLALGILRSNSTDNLELNARFAGLASDAATGALEFAVQAGVAWNLQTDTADDHGGHKHYVLPGGGAGGASNGETAEANEMQAYGQVIANALFAGRFALGVVPTLLWNPRIRSHDPETTLSVGVNGQLYLDRTWSLIGEWIFSRAREGQQYDSGSFGAEIRTGGHFFKLLVTNQHRMNPTQTLAGAAEDFLDTGSWRFGFNVERRLGGLSRMK